MKYCEHFLQIGSYLFVTDVPPKENQFDETALWVSRVVWCGGVMQRCGAVVWWRRVLSFGETAI